MGHEPTQAQPYSRKPVRWLTYPGRWRETDLGQVVGPNTLGELLVSVAVGDYDEATDSTRVGFAYATIHDTQAVAS